MKRIFLQGAYLWSLFSFALELEELKKFQEQEWNGETSKAWAVFHKSPQEKQGLKDTAQRQYAAPRKEQSLPPTYKRWRTRKR